MRLIDADAVCERCRASGAICTGKDCEIPNMPALTPPNEWVSVEERLPEEETDVLILVKETDDTTGADHPDMAWWQFVGWLVDGEWESVYCHGNRAIAEENARGNSVHEVTHWMPLPEPPKEG